MASVVAAWPTVALDELMRQDVRYVSELEPRMYPKLSVKWWGKGAVLDTPTDGATVRMSRHQLAKPGQVIVSEIWAKHGSIGIVPPEGAGALVTSHFFLFDINESRLMREYMDYLIQGNYLTALLADISQGTTSYAAVRPQQFLSVAIPLPPLDEQRRIVGRIAALAGRIAEARGLRQAAMAETEALWMSELKTVWANEDSWEVRQLGQFARAVSGQVDPLMEPYANMPHINGEFMESGTCRLLPNYQLAKDAGVTSGKYHFGAGAILYSKIRPYLMKAVQVPFEGICSADVYAFECFDSMVTPRFFMYSLISPRFTHYANEVSGRTRMPKINQEQLYEFPMRVPALHEQKRIVAHLDRLQARLGDVRQVQIQSDNELDVLLPSLLDKAFRGEL